MTPSDDNENQAGSPRDAIGTSGGLDELARLRGLGGLLASLVLMMEEYRKALYSLPPNHDRPAFEIDSTLAIAARRILDLKLNIETFIDRHPLKLPLGPERELNVLETTIRKQLDRWGWEFAATSGLESLGGEIGRRFSAVQARFGRPFLEANLAWRLMPGVERSGDGDKLANDARECGLEPMALPRNATPEGVKQMVLERWTAFRDAPLFDGASPIATEVEKIAITNATSLLGDTALNIGDIVKSAEPSMPLVEIRPTFNLAIPDRSRFGAATARSLADSLRDLAGRFAGASGNDPSIRMVAVNTAMYGNPVGRASDGVERCLREGWRFLCKKAYPNPGSFALVAIMGTEEACSAYAAIAESAARFLNRHGLLEYPGREATPEVDQQSWPLRFMEWIYFRSMDAPETSLLKPTTKRSASEPGSFDEASIEMGVAPFHAAELALRLEADAVEAGFSQPRSESIQTALPQPTGHSLASEAQQLRPGRRARTDDPITQVMFDQYVEGRPELEIIAEHVPNEFTGNEDKQKRALRKRLKRFAERYGLADPIESRRKSTQNGGQ